MIHACIMNLGAKEKKKTEISRMTLFRSQGVRFTPGGTSRHGGKKVRSETTNFKIAKEKKKIDIMILLEE